MTKGDRIVEEGSSRLRELSARAAAKGGIAEKLAQPLAEDADFLRKLKPSLIKARAKGEAHTDRAPAQPPAAPSSPQVTRKRKGDGGPNPFAVIGAALVVGIVVAKVLDWRGHAHPND